MLEDHPLLNTNGSGPGPGMMDQARTFPGALLGLQGEIIPHLSIPNIIHRKTINKIHSTFIPALQDYQDSFLDRLGCTIMDQKVSVSNDFQFFIDLKYYVIYILAFVHNSYIFPRPSIVCRNKFIVIQGVFSLGCVQETRKYMLS